jgi:hypothetical protein
VDSAYKLILNIYYLCRSYSNNDNEITYIIDIYSCHRKLKNLNVNSEIINEYLNTFPEIAEFEMELLPRSTMEKIVSFLRALPMFITAGLGRNWGDHYRKITVDDLQENTFFSNKKRGIARNNAKNNVSKISHSSLKLLQTIKPNNVDHLKWV